MSNTMLKDLRAFAFVSAAAFAIAALATSAAYADDSSQVEAQATATNTQLYASPSQVRLVQQTLGEKGHDAGRVDGVWGEATADAVREFQKANDLSATGQLDTSLLSALEIGDVLEGRTQTGFLDGLLRPDQEDIDASTGKGAPIFVSPAHIAQVQGLLEEQGHYSGEIDGLWGPSTAEAANAYREAQGLEASTGIDIALLQALNQNAAEAQQQRDIASGAEGVPLQVGAATVRALQRQLSEEGHEAGAVDGQLGANTQEALRAFQRDNDLEATGTLTLPTLAALGIDITDPAQQAAFEARPGDATETEQEADAVATAED